ncbi:MAG TPA: chemotaxis protein CheX [Polyangiales bacterium]|nr:chemotaxis protein CheX [Polyangiales bacterium]
MQASQHVLIAGPGEDGRGAIAAVLKTLDMVVSWAPSFEVARRSVERARDLAMVVVDARTSPEDAVGLLVCVKDLHRGLPVMWIGTDPRAPVQPDALLPAAADPHAIEESARTLLRDDLYPPRLVRTFVSACNTALTAMFDCGVESAEPSLSRSALRSGNVTALMFMPGNETTAHLALSADEGTLVALAQQIGFDPAEGKRRLAIDMASELVNQIMGRMKSTSEQLEMLMLGLSYVFTGESFSMYAPTGKPSLSVELTCNLPGRLAPDGRDPSDDYRSPALRGGSPATTLTVDFWFKTRVASNPEADRYTAELTSGGLLFL